MKRKLRKADALGVSIFFCSRFVFFKNFKDRMIWVSHFRISVGRLWTVTYESDVGTKHRWASRKWIGRGRQGCTTFGTTGRPHLPARVSIFQSDSLLLESAFIYILTCTAFCSLKEWALGIMGFSTAQIFKAWRHFVQQYGGNLSRIGIKPVSQSLALLCVRACEQQCEQKSSTWNIIFQV
jgi:hypothetical protein